MLDTNYIRNNLELVKKKVEAKGVPFAEERFSVLDQRRRQLLSENEELKSKKNRLAKATGVLKQSGTSSSELELQSIELSKMIAAQGHELGAVEKEFHDFILNIPNLFHDSVPVGRDSAANELVRQWGEKPVFAFTPLPHWELGEGGETLDFARAAKISGSRFTLYFDALAKLERVLIQFMLDVHTGENGYREVLPPFLVNDASLIGTGNLPKFKDDLFKIEGYNLYLIPTAEVPLTNIHRDEILDECRLPINYVAYTPCFRSEAGSHGKDIRGLVRQHQFNKVELLKFTTPEHSYAELEKLTAAAESILRKLNLPYRTMALCSGDLSFSTAKTYDIEVWMPARAGYLEISSCSNFESFQARRARIKFKSKDGKKDFVHTLNGSGLAVGRTVAAIMENYQTADGKIRIPEVLRHYFPGRETL
ncbi:MAG: serine--tRNA ligase [Acidobacteria bacterium]|nr:serine--tRNA ligase [Acidobacteriota bacterium]MBU4306972.1 serine--tRNA ligase [Acidobacteriota bacterium]MBU4405626.1 serine--tRNA ligase [Acidobacteriota bacterium]MCG2812165.1 serine--tRNA ligase [Candidatus Aminicenantes bacterium]